MKKVPMRYLWRKNIWIGLTPSDCPEWAMGATIEECYQDFWYLLRKYGLPFDNETKSVTVSD